MNRSDVIIGTIVAVLAAECLIAMGVAWFFQRHGWRITVIR